MLSLRDYAGVRDENRYLFATGTGGEGHSQGSKDIEHVVKSISGFQKPELLTATKIRHKKSSDFAEIEGDHTEEEIDLFYKHMGHDKQISKDVYQCPRAIRTLQHVGRILEGIEEDEGDILCAFTFIDLLLSNDNLSCNAISPKHCLQRSFYLYKTFF